MESQQNAHFRVTCTRSEALNLPWVTSHINLRPQSIVHRYIEHGISSTRFLLLPLLLVSNLNSYSQILASSVPSIRRRSCLKIKSKILAYSDFILVSYAQLSVLQMPTDFYTENIIGSNN